MRKILARIAAPSKVEGAIEATKYNRLMIAYVALFVIYQFTLGVLKALIFRRPSFSLNNETTTSEKVFLALEACRLIFNACVLWLFIMSLKVYLHQIRGAATA